MQLQEPLTCRYHPANIAPRSESELRVQRKMSHSSRGQVEGSGRCLNHHRKMRAHPKSRPKLKRAADDLEQRLLGSNGALRPSDSALSAYRLTSRVAGQLRCCMDSIRVYQHPTLNPHAYESKNPSPSSSPRQSRPKPPSPTSAAPSSPPLYSSPSPSSDK